MTTSAAVVTDLAARDDGRPAVTDVAVIGAGPYGLAAAARLREVHGLDVRIFGEPMSFWMSMPRGMWLRSNWDACHIAFPAGDLTLDAFQAERGTVFDRRVPLDVFIRYGLWFQRAAVPDVDTRQVRWVNRAPGGFRLVLSDGEVVRSARVVVAAGIESFPRWPAQFASSPRKLVTHSSEHRDLGAFAGARVLVVGGGQSALESATLLHEASAQVEVVARTEQITWLHGGIVQRKLGRFKPLFYAQTDVGPAGLSRLVAVPALFRQLPRALQTKLAYRAIRPAGARWLIDRLAAVPITTGRRVVSVCTAEAGICIALDDGSERHADHLILGTGYQVDVTKYSFLAPELLDDLRRVDGYPVLGRGLQSSIPGLHFLGAPAAWSHGPIMRFVSGSWYASQQLAKHLHNLSS